MKNLKLPIKTKRLKMNITTLNEVNLMLNMDKQEETQKYLGGIKNKTKEERKIFLQNKYKKYQKEELLPLTIFLDENQIGLIELKIDKKKNNAEISYIFDCNYTNKGYCTEVVEKIIDIGFNHLMLNNISAKVLKENIASTKVLEKNNFKKIGTQENYLIYEIINKKKIINVVAALIEKNNRILIAKRLTGDNNVLGKWEFPGGKVELNENEFYAIEREIREELEINVKAKDFIKNNICNYPSKIVNLKLYRCEYMDGIIKLHDHSEYKWVEKNRLLCYDLAPADIPLAEYVINKDV